MSASVRDACTRSRRLLDLWEMFDFDSVLYINRLRAIREAALAVEILADGNGVVAKGEAAAELCRNIQLEIDAGEGPFQNCVPIFKASLSSLVKSLDAPISWGQFSNRLKYLVNLLQDEMRSERFIQLDAQEAQWYTRNAEDYFGDDVCKKLMAGDDYDLVESMRSLAFGRSTACVFHLMRVMEVSLRAWASTFNIDPAVLMPKTQHLRDRMWGELGELIGKEVQAMPTSSDSQKDAKRSQQAVLLNLDHVRQVWRNPTMHPQAKYTESEAREVMEASRVFLRSAAAAI